MKLLLPGIFLFILGSGNITVGTFKGHQYQQVIEELSHLEPTPRDVDASPLRRIQLARQTTGRLYQRQIKAKNRRDFYRLVTFGGKIIAAASLLLLVPGGVLIFSSYRRAREQYGALPKNSS